MVTTLIFLHNGWILLFWLVPLIHIRGLCVSARAVILVDVALKRFSFALQQWLEHPVHSTRGRTRMASVRRFGPGRSTAIVDSSTTLSSKFHHGNATRIEFDLCSEETGTVNVRHCQPVRVIVFMHYVRIMISLPYPCMTFYYIISANVVNSKYTRLHTLVSYVLLVVLGAQLGKVCYYSITHSSTNVRDVH